MTLSWMTPQILSVFPQTQAWGVGLFFDEHRFATWISARSLAGSAEPFTWPTWFCGLVSVQVVRGRDPVRTRGQRE